MTRSTKKETERAYLDEFRRLLARFPKGGIAEGEDPDFKIGQEPQVGVEVTEVLRRPEPGNGPMKEQESLRRHVVDLAEKSLHHTGTPKLFVSAYFARLTKGRVRQIATCLANLVVHRCPSQGQIRTLKRTWADGEQWPPELLGLSIWHPEGTVAGFWHGSGPAEHVESCSVDTLQAELDRKEAKLSIDPSLAENWLLMVMNGHDHSGFFVLPEDVLGHHFKSGFDRVWLLRTFEGVVNELRLG